MTLRDTSDQARQRQLDLYAEMPGPEKIELAFDMAEQAKNIALDGIRSRNPDLPEPEVHLAWLHLLHGDLASRLPHRAASKAS